MNDQVTIEGQDAKAVMDRVIAGLTPTAIDGIVDRVAAQTFESIVEKTPRKWFGQVRRSWRMETPKPGTRVIVNNNKVMLWLEEGTQAHGPVRAKALFIPLTRKAVLAYMSGIGFEPSSKKFFVNGLARKALSVLRRGKAIEGQEHSFTPKRTTLIYGVDYVLAKRVRGIQPMKIAAGEQVLVAARLQTELTNFVVNVLQNG